MEKKGCYEDMFPVGITRINVVCAIAALLEEP